jgi:hypothetical protein
MSAFISVFILYVIIYCFRPRGGEFAGLGLVPFIGILLAIGFATSFNRMYYFLRPAGVTIEQEKLLKSRERKDWFILLVIPLFFALIYLANTYFSF